MIIKRHHHAPRFVCTTVQMEESDNDSQVRNRAITQMPKFVCGDTQARRYMLCKEKFVWGSMQQEWESLTAPVPYFGGSIQDSDASKRD